MQEFDRKSFSLKKIIACDLDGTFSYNAEPISSELISMLTRLFYSGWVILFPTGRTLVWAKKDLDVLPFPIYIAPFNGVALYTQKSPSFFSKIYSYFLIVDNLEKHITPLIYQYGGVLYDVEGRIFVAPSPSEKIWDHMKKRRDRQGESWISLAYPHFSLECLSIRIFFLKDELASLRASLDQILIAANLYAVFVQDSFSKEIIILQIGHKDRTKKTALDWFKKEEKNVKIIAIGDDLNDIPMFQGADVSIAVDPHSSEVASHATYVTSRRDLIDNVDMVIDQIERSI